MKKRTMKEIRMVLSIMLDSYDVYRDVLKFNFEKSKKRVLDDYDDFDQWVYREGDFK